MFTHLSRLFSGIFCLWNVCGAVRDAGLGAVLISLTNLTSAGQFAGSSLMLAGGSYLEIAVTTVVINIRYFLMSLAMSQKTDKKMTWIQRLLVSFGITDEIFAVSMQAEGKLTASYMAGLILTPVIGWTGGTLAGGILTSFLPTNSRQCP